MRGHNGVLRSRTQWPLTQAVNGTVHIIEPDALADPRRADAVANRLDDTCTIVMDQDLFRNHWPLRARAQLHIRWVHPGGTHGDQNLSGTGGRGVSFLQHQSVPRGAACGVENCFHARSCRLFSGFAAYEP